MYAAVQQTWRRWPELRAGLSEQVACHVMSSLKISHLRRSRGFRTISLLQNERLIFHSAQPCVPPLADPAAQDLQQTSMAPQQATVGASRLHIGRPGWSVTGAVRGQRGSAATADGPLCTSSVCSPLQAAPAYGFGRPNEFLLATPATHMHPQPPRARLLTCRDFRTRPGVPACG